MKIQREVNGQMMEFELTPSELSRAYYEQEHLFDIEDIEDALKSYHGTTSTPEEYDGPSEFFNTYNIPFNKVYQNEALINEMAYEKRRKIDKYGISWEDARDEAISEVLERHRDELCEVREAQTFATDVHPGLPESCFSISETTGELIVIRRGEMGYCTTPWSTHDTEKNREFAESHNAEMGITKAQVAAMVVGSLFGWHVQAANPSAYDENGKMKRESLSEQISSAEQQQKSAEETMVEMSYGDLCSLLRSVESTGKGHVSAHVVFTEDSFTQPYSEETRTYVFSSDNKAFQAGMGGYSIFASCLDGTDPCIRLEAYMAAEKGGKDGWKIERCYMSQAEINKANGLIKSARDSRDNEER